MPVRWQIPIAALLSAQTSKAAENPRSWATADNPKPSAPPLATPASSASLELKAMVFCVVDQCLMARKPRMRTHPRVNRRASKRPAKS
eukprot:10199118-Alexandrium_andersonii.AAC.1